MPPLMSYPPSITNPVSELGLPRTSQPSLCIITSLPTQQCGGLGVTTHAIPAQGFLRRSTGTREHQSPQRAWPGQQLGDRSPAIGLVLKTLQFQPCHPIDPSKAWRAGIAIPSRSLANLEPKSRLAATCPKLRSLPSPPRQAIFVQGVCRMWLSDPSQREAALCAHRFPGSSRVRKAESPLCAGEGVRYPACRQLNWGFSSVERLAG